MIPIEDLTDVTLGIEDTDEDDEEDEEDFFNPDYLVYCYKQELVGILSEKDR